MKMPTSSEAETPEIRVNTAYNGERMITYISQDITFEQLCDEMRDICKFTPDQLFTMKWIDDEGDPCTLSDQAVLDNAIRVCEVNKEPELLIHGEFQTYFGVGRSGISRGRRTQCFKDQMTRQEMTRVGI